MGLQNGTIMDGATNSSTGGTSKTLTTDGLNVVNGVHLIDASVTDYRTRPNVTAKNKPPVLQQDGSYGKAKRSLTLAFPKVLSNGKQGFPLVRIELEDYPELTDAERVKMLTWAGQSTFRADFQSFWLTGSLG